MIKILDIKVMITTLLRKKVIRNSFFNTGSSVINILVALISTPFIVKKLSLEGYGIYVLLTSLIGYYSLLDLGLGQAVVKYVAEYKAKKDTISISNSINSALFIQIFSGIIGSTILIMFSDSVIRILHISNSFYGDVRVAIYFSAVGFFFTMIGGTFISVLNGLQKYDITSKMNTLINLLQVLGVIVLLILGFGIKTIIFYTATLAIISFCVSIILVKKNIHEWKYSPIPKKKFIKILFNFSGFLFISNISNLFSNYLAKFIISFFLGPVSVAYYAIAQKVTIAVGSILYSASNVLFPYSSEIGAEANLPKLIQILVKSSKIFTSVSAPLFLIIMAFSKQILSVWMGIEFAKNAWPILSIIAFNGLVASSTAVPNLLTMGLGYSKIIAKYSIITSVFLITTLFLFTKMFGVIGTCISMTISTLPGLFLVYKEVTLIFKMKYRYYYANVYSFHIIPFVIFLCALMILNRVELKNIYSISLILLSLVSYCLTMFFRNWPPNKLKY